MNTDEQARKLMAHQRQHSEHLDHNMLSRAAQEGDIQSTEETEEKARQLLAQERQQSEHLQETMLDRATKEIQ